MLSHEHILAALRDAFPADAARGLPGVSLVARLREPALAMTDSTPYVFIPDVHLVPSADAARFPWVTASDLQVAALAQLAQALAALRAQDATFRVWQLGDLFDLWRTGDLGGTVQADADATVDDRQALVQLLREGCGVGILIGNHDAELLDYAFPWGGPAERSIVLTRTCGAGDTVVLHGHQFDPIERLPREWKELFARGATERVPPIPRTMLEATNPHWKPQPIAAPPPQRPADAWKFLHFALTGADPVPLDSDAVNVIQHSPVADPTAAFLDGLGRSAGKPTVDGPRQTFFSDAASFAAETSVDGRDVRLVIIGHTHQARIVRGARLDGTPFVLMDCGAWVGTSFLSDELDRPILNAQIGVKVADDIRIYQLGYCPRT